MPGIPNETENIHIISIVGRFLEHSRIFRFGTGKEQKLFIASADIMTRNMQRRVEVACPIYSEPIKDRINEMLNGMFYDTEKARIMQSDGTYKRKPENLNKINIQEFFIEEAKIKAITSPRAEIKLRHKILPIAANSIQMIGKHLFGMISSTEGKAGMKSFL